MRNSTPHAGGASAASSSVRPPTSSGLPVSSGWRLDGERCAPHAVHAQPAFGLDYQIAVFRSTHTRWAAHLQWKSERRRSAFSKRKVKVLRCLAAFALSGCTAEKTCPSIYLHIVLYTMFFDYVCTLLVFRRITTDVCVFQHKSMQLAPCSTPSAGTQVVSRAVGTAGTAAKRSP